MFVYSTQQQHLCIYKTKRLYMLSLDEIQKQLQDRNLVMVANATGLSYMTVWKVKTGKQDNFSYDTVKRLSDYLEFGV